MIGYFNQDCSFKLKNRRLLSQWIKESAGEEGFSAGEIAIIFCSDAYLLEINRQYLNHDYPTDVITFDNRDPLKPKRISGDIFVSIDMVKENAEKYGATFETELRRVVIHGILHLCGYRDKSRADIRTMRAKENYYLTKLNAL